ncbi:MAG: hypothetical protein JSS49_10800 [Planctomycetes bacterium]|nr:hypothetical protein [Planctomycetota bacterium]
MSARFIGCYSTALVVFTVFSTDIACGRVYSPRILTSQTADTYSPRTFANHPAWKNLSPELKAKAIFDYLTDRETGLYPLGAGAFEGGDKAYEFSLVRDPMKIVNVYGYGYCDVFGPVMAGLWEQGGCGQARTVDLPGMKHVACEVLANDRWRYLDVDLRGIFLSQDGDLRSLQEALQDPTLWQHERGPRFFPRDDLANLQEQFRKSTVEHRYSVAPSGHTLDFVLRRGETFTRWWQPQGGRWLLGSDDAKNPARKELLERDPRGPKSKHAEFTTHTHGNGRFVYQPNLKKSADDFEDGVFAAHNLHVTEHGLTLKAPGDGWAVFEVRSPYVIVPVVGKLEDPKDDSEASVIEVDAAEATLAWSPDFGDSWITLEPKQWPAVMDLTPQVAGSYGYLFKVALKGKPDAAVVRSLKITTWVQQAPATLPALKSGDNSLELKTGDHYGLPSRVLSIQPNCSDENAFLHYLLRAPQEYDPTSRSARAKGPLIARLPALPKTRIAWFSAGASFGMPVGPDSSAPHNSIAYAANAPRDFQPLFVDGPGGVNPINRPTPQSHWHYNVDREVKLDSPANAIYVRYDGNPLNSYRLYAHCVEEEPVKPTPLRVTHAWTEAGQPREYTQSLEPGTDRYQIQAGPDPVNVSIELSVPGGME